jgi:hypothetical protein
LVLIRFIAVFRQPFVVEIGRLVLGIPAAQAVRLECASEGAERGSN